MKPQEDIGSLIKTKLQSAKKASNEATWERIQHSLKERKRKRRFAFYTKLGSVGLVILLGALFILNDPTMVAEEEITSQEDIHSKTDDQNIVGSEVNKGLHLPSEGTKTITNTADAETLDHKTDDELASDKTAAITKQFTSKDQAYRLDILKESSENTKTLDSVVNKNDVPVTQTSQKVYYYYNSKNGQEVSSTDKKVIDSIVKMNQTKKDSLSIKN